MGIFDVFTGAPAQRAAEQTRQYLGQQEQQALGGYSTAVGTGTTAINTGTTGALGSLAQGYGGAEGAVSGALPTSMGYLSAGLGGALGATDQARTDLGQAAGAWQPLADIAGRYGSGTSLYMDALGVNGQAGIDRARAAFSTSPGYQWSVDQATEAARRSAAAQGIVGSGNTLTEVSDRAQNLANQQWDNYMARLQGLINPELQAATAAAGGRAGAYTGMANVDQGTANLLAQYGINAANMNQGTAQMLAQLLQQQGTATAGVQTGQGTQLANLGLAGAQGSAQTIQALAPAYGQTYGQEAAAQMQGSQNLWNLGMNVARMAMGLPPGPMGGTSGGSTGTGNWSLSGSPIGQLGSWLGGLGGGGGNAAWGGANVTGLPAGLGL